MKKGGASTTPTVPCTKQGRSFNSRQHKHSCSSWRRTQSFLYILNKKLHMGVFFNLRLYIAWTYRFPHTREWQTGSYYICKKSSSTVSSSVNVCTRTARLRSSFIPSISSPILLVLRYQLICFRNVFIPNSSPYCAI